MDQIKVNRKHYMYTPPSHTKFDPSPFIILCVNFTNFLPTTVTHGVSTAQKRFWLGSLRPGSYNGTAKQVLTGHKTFWAAVFAPLFYVHASQTVGTTGKR
jgi:hypothetical protein